MTAVEWLKEKMKKHYEEFGGLNYSEYWNEEFQQALELEKQQSQDYAKFAINCDRKEMPILNFEDYIKL